MNVPLDVILAHASMMCPSISMALLEIRRLENKIRVSSAGYSRNKGRNIVLQTLQLWLHTKVISERE